MCATATAKAHIDLDHGPIARACRRSQGSTLGDARFDMISAANFFTARAIVPDRADAAYPLARIAAPRLTIEDWRRLVAQISVRTSMPFPRLGILVAEDCDGYICGLGTYHPAIDLDHGCMAIHAELVIPALFDPRLVALALLEKLRAEAERSACRAIHIHLPTRVKARSNPSHGLATALADAGYDATSSVVRWCLARTVGSGAPLD
jgi:hypothetical protein